MAALKDLLLADPPLTVSAAESLTCGQVQATIGAVSGASAYFVGGITAYTLDQKVRHLGVDRRAAKRVDAVSATVAEQMARGACTLFDSDLAVATTGYAEPMPATGILHPFAWWALAHRGRRGKWITVRSGRIECPDAPRIEAQTLIAAGVIAELTTYLDEWRKRRRRRTR